MRRLALAVLLTGLLFGQSPPQFINTPTGLSFYWQAIPTVSTNIISTTVRITSITFCNTTGSAITITFQTKDASPVQLPLAGSLAANTCANFNIPAGLLSNGGMNISASATGGNYSIVWLNP